MGAMTGAVRETGAAVVASGTFTLASATGAASGRAGPFIGTFNCGATVVAEPGRATGVTAASETLILDSATGAASGRAGPFIGTFNCGATVVAEPGRATGVTAASETLILDSAT